MTVVEQTRRVRAVDVFALALTIGAATAAYVRTFVPIEAEPSQRVDNHPLRRARAARHVGVFDTQDELAALAAREDLIDQRDIGGSEMRIPRW